MIEDDPYEKGDRIGDQKHCQKKPEHRDNTLKKPIHLKVSLEPARLKKAVKDPSERFG